MISGLSPQRWRSKLPAVVFLSSAQTSSSVQTAMSSTDGLEQQISLHLRNNQLGFRKWTQGTTLNNNA